MSRFALVSILCVLVVGCGKDKPDVGPVEVRVYDQSGAPDPAVDVVYHSRDGSVVAHVATDASGVAYYDSAPRDGMVSVARRELFPYHVQTLTGVQPLDILVFGEPRTVGTPVNITITFTAQHPSAKGYLIDVGCHLEFLAAYQAAVTFQIDDTCADTDGNLSVVAYGTDDAWLIHGFTFQRDVPLDTGGTFVTVPDWINTRNTFNVDIPFVPWGEVAYTRARFVGVGDSFVPPMQFTDYERSYVVDSTDPIQSTYQLPTGFETALGYALELRGSGREGFLIRRDLTLPIQTVFDIDKDFLPFPEGYQFDLLDELVPKPRPGATYALPSDPGSDAVGLELVWAAGSGEAAEFRWDVVAPANVTELRVPQMPQALLRYTPLVGDEYRSAAVWSRQADFLNDHRDYFRYQKYFETTPTRFTTFPPTFEIRSSLQRDEFP